MGFYKTYVQFCKYLNMFISFALIFFGTCILLKLIFRSKKRVEETVEISPDPVNKYIKNHEEKLKDDKDYEDYIQWCMIKGEIAVEQEGYDVYRMQEYLHYKRLMKHGLSGHRK